MEKQFLQNKNHEEREVVPLNQARFLDKLEPEYEQQWNSMLDSAAELKINMKDFALPLWGDDTFPQAIRDRALLLVVGKDDHEKWKGPWGAELLQAFFGFNERLNGLATSSTTFKSWLEEALSYGDIIDDKVLYKLSYDYFTNGDWDQQQFEQTLEKFDPAQVQRVWQNPFDEYDSGLPVLPYIDDILNGRSVSKSNMKMQQWAQEKYDIYIQNFILNEKILPSWLQNLSPAVIKNVVQREYKKVENDEILPLNIIAAYEKYLIGFYDGFRFEQYEAACNGSSILKHLGEFSQRTLLAYLQSRYQDAIQFRGTLTREDEDIILSHITVPLPVKFIDFADRMDKIRAEESKAYTEWLIKEKESRKKREAERVIDKQRQKDARIKLHNAKAAYLHAQGIFTNDK